MKKCTLAVSIAAITLCSIAAGLAQSVTVMVAPGERTQIKEYVAQGTVAPVAVKERIAVGTKLPADVELLTVPPNWGAGYTKYRYVYANDNVYLIEPSSREVVQVID